jgi:hypothetical protein
VPAACTEFGLCVTGAHEGLEEIASKAKQKCAVPASQLAPGKTLEVPVVKPCALNNNGAIIALLDSSATKTTGVSYAKEQAQGQGWTVGL